MIGFADHAQWSELPAILYAMLVLFSPLYLLVVVGLIDEAWQRHKKRRDRRFW